MGAGLVISEGEYVVAPLRETASQRPVDLAHLSRFTLGNRDLEREVLDMFAAQLPRTIGDLKSASSEKDWHMAAHTLKGSARAVGAWRVAECAELAERASSLADRQECLRLIARIESEAGAAVRYIEELAVLA